jgi:hypothetical protein
MFACVPVFAVLVVGGVRNGKQQSYRWPGEGLVYQWNEYEW